MGVFTIQFDSDLMAEKFCKDAETPNDFIVFIFLNFI